MDSICQGYNNPIIYKVIWKHGIQSNDTHKYIFVGHKESEIKKILKKLQDGYDNIGSSEKKKLENVIPYYKKIFGEIIPNRTYFVYYYIDNLDNINQIKECIFNFVGTTDKQKEFLLPDNQYIWAEPNKITFDYYTKIVNSIFIDKLNINKSHFISKLSEISLLDESQLINKIVELSPNKFNMSDKKPQTLNRKHFSYEYVFNNEEIRNLVTSFPVSISNQWYSNYKDSKYLYMFSPNPYDLIKSRETTSIKTDKIKGDSEKKEILDDKKSLKNINLNLDGVSNNLKHSSKLLLFCGNYTDDNLYLTTKNDLENLIQKNELKYYFPKSYKDSDDKKNKFKFESLVSELKEKKQLSLNIPTNLNDNIEKFVKQSDCKFKKLIFKINNEQSINDINIEHIFKKFQTYQIIPIIKLSNSNPKIRDKYKINIPFIKKETTKHILDLFKDDNTNKLIQHNISYIQFVSFLNNNTIIHIKLYKNGMVVVSSIFHDYQNTIKINKIIKVVNLIFKNIKKSFKIKELTQININDILKKKIVSLSPVEIVYCKLNYQYKFKENISQKDFKNIISALGKIDKYYSFITNPVYPNIKLVFKAVSKFYSDKNIYKHIAQYFRKNGGRLNNKQKEVVIQKIKNLFMLTSDKASNYINKFTERELSDYNELDKGVIVNLNINKDTLNINFEYVENFIYVRKILQLLNIILYDILTKTNNIHILNESKEKIIEKQSDISFDLDLYDDIQKDIDDFEIDPDFEIDSDFEIDLEDISSLKKQIEKDRIEEEKEKLDDNKQEISVDVERKQLKKKNMKFTTYMNTMRKEMDPDLYKDDKEYNRNCPSNMMRQPYIVSKEELDTFNPDAYTGYMKYRGKYYICPRIWDAYVNKPVSVEDFIKSGNRSPYSKEGKPLPANKTKQEINQDYSIVIRRPVSDAKMDFADPNKEKKWPDILKRSGKDTFPGFTSKLYKTSPKLCRPCCFGNVPSDYDYSKNGFQELKNVSGSKKCSVDTLDDDKKEGESKKEDEDLSAYDNYVKNETTDLTENRLGLLPSNLDIILNNNQDLFLSKDRHKLNENANCFLRCGVKKNVNGNFLECLGFIRQISNINKFKSVMVDNLPVEIFINLNNGDLVEIYSSNDLLPNIVSKKKIQLFIKFLISNKKLYLMMGITRKNINNFEQIIESKKEVKLIKKFVLLYKIYTSYNNFIKNILNDDIPINYKHCLDLLSRPNNIFENGINLLIFDKETDKLECNPYLKNLNKYAILIKDSDYKFTPIVHTQMKYKVIKRSGVIKLDNNININSEISKYLINKGANPNLVKYTKNRLKFFINLYKIHSNSCLKDNIYPDGETDLDYIQSNKLMIKAYIITNNLRAQYIQLSTDDLLPIYPIAIGTNVFVKLLTEVELQDNVKDLWNKYKIINNKLNNKFQYEPQVLLVNHNELATGIKFKNGLIVPIKQQKIPASMSNIPIENMEIYVDYSNIALKEKIQIHQLLYQDYVYQQFKYEFSGLINESNNYKNKKHIENILISGEEHDFDYYQKINKIIEKIMNPLKSSKLKESLQITPGVNIGKCYKTVKKNCKKNPLCNYDDKNATCKLNIDDDMLKLFSFLLTQDLINSSSETYKILNGYFVPQFKFSNMLFKKQNELIVEEDDIMEQIKNIKISDYRKNIKMIDFLKMSDISYVINQKDISDLDSYNEKEFLKNIDQIVTILANATLNYILPTDIVVATPYDKDGRMDTRYKAGPCIFPYLDTSNYNLRYNCLRNNKKMFVCPVSLNLDKKPIKWGYCPEDPNITKNRLNIIPVTTTGNKEKKYYPGECNFPYMVDNYNLIFNCSNDKDDKGNSFSWCPIKLKKGDTTKYPVLVGTDNAKNIYNGKWNFRDMYFPKSKKFNPNFLKTHKKGYCQEPVSNKFTLKKKFAPIKFEDYNPLSCKLVPTKGGYENKEQLFHFGYDVLKIPKVMMMKGDVILAKDKLCNIINAKYKKIVESLSIDNNKESTIQFDFTKYKKDISKCREGSTKGGYKLQELKKIAVDHFGLSQNDALSMKKDDICDYLNKIFKDYIEVESKTEDYTNIKVLDVEVCKTKNPNRGGFKLSYLKKLAIFLEIDINKGEYAKTKGELCEEISRKLIEMRTVVNTIKKNKRTKFTTKKLQKLKTLSDLRQYEDDQLGISDSNNIKTIKKPKKLTKKRTSSNK